jgi:PAS domain S-box-containing protein
VLINSTPDIICFKDAQGRWIQANNGLLDLYCLQGVDYYNKTEFELADFTAEIYQDAFRNCGESDEQAWQAARPSRTIESIPDIQGNMHIFDVLKIPLYNDDNSRKGLVVFGRDITESKNNEEALAKNEEKYRLIAENTGDTIWIMDLDFKYSYISPAIVRLTGNAPEVEMKRTLDEILTPSSLQIAIDAFNHELEHDSDPTIDINRTMNLDLEIYHKDGHIVYVRETMTFIRDEAGKPIAIQGITHDITDRVVAAQQIQINEYRLQSLLRLSEYKPDNVQQLFDYALNDALLLFGCEFGLVLSYDFNAKTLSPIAIAGTATMLFPKNPSQLAYPLEAAGLWAYPILHKDELLLNTGHSQPEVHSIIPVQVDKVKNLMAIPLLIDDAVVSIIAIGNRESNFAPVDIQQLKLMMHSVWKMVQRRKDEDKIRQLSKGIEQSPAAVVITDLEGKIEYVNSRFTEVTGHPKNKVMGKVMRILKPGITSPELFNQIWNTIRGGNDWKGEFYNKRADNTYYWEDVSISPITDSTGAITHYIAIKEDITDRKKMIDELILAKEQAEEVSRIKSSLLANMSHEIRTPLNGILGFAELLKEDAKDENQQHMAEIIYSSGSRLMNTLNSILDLSLIEAQSDKLKLKTIDLNLLVQESTMLFNAMAARKGLYLNSILSNEPLMALGDENLINKIINNLVNNALKFTKTGGVTVRGGVKLKDQTTYACISVEDTGIGIPDKYKDIIFKEFRQASEGHTRAFEGTGLGLHLAARFAQVMGGEITVQSTLGQGSCFTFWLPMELSSMPDLTVLMEEPKPIPKLTEVVQKILVVDDDKDSMDLAMMILRKLYNCDFVDSGVKAVELAKQYHYSCILMDISLRGEIGGIEAIRQIRLLPGYSNTPIAAFTANALAGHREEYLSKGCTHYLAKPYRKQDLLKMIDEMVHNTRLFH